MNFLKKMENLLEQVDSQAAKTIQSPKTVLPTMLSTGAIGRSREPGMFDASTQELIDEDFDLDLSLTDIEPERPLPRSVSTPAVRQPPRIRAEQQQRQQVLPRVEAKPRPVERKQVEDEFFGDVGAAAAAPAKATTATVSSWDDWEDELSPTAADAPAENETEGEIEGEMEVGSDRDTETEGETADVAVAGENHAGENTETAVDSETEVESDTQLTAVASLLSIDDTLAEPKAETKIEETARDRERATAAPLSPQSPPLSPPLSHVTEGQRDERESGAVRRLETKLRDTAAELEDARAELSELTTEKSNLAVECRLAKSRFASLQQKAKELSDRHSKLQQVMKGSQAQMKRLQEEKTLLSAKVDTLEKQREKLDAELRARDSQQVQLQAALEEKENELAALQERTSELSVQLEHYGSVQRELEVGKTRHLEEEASRREELENELEQRRAEQQREREEASQRRQALEEEVAQLSGTLNGTMEELQRLREQRQRDTAEIKRYIKDTSALRQELTGYKKRAAQVLQEKDTQILNLSQPSLDSGDDFDSAPTQANALRSDEEVIEIIAERDQLADQLHVAEQRLQALSESLMEVERQAAEEQELLRVELDEAQAGLEQERARIKQFQLDRLSLSKELAAAREKLDNLHLAHRKELEAKEAAVEKLKRKMQLQANSSSSESELEERLQQMTDNIIKKQTIIDTLTSENAALQMHLESKLQSDDGGSGLSYHRGGDAPPAYDRRAEAVEYEEMGRERDTDRVTPLMTLVPNLALSDSFLAQQVKKSAAFIDNLTAQVNQLLRQHPSARLSLGIYLIAVHVYILFSFFAAGEVIAESAE
mmetsp:Transcript_20342/g.77880  ORF Transcript_20342/g.77880 Transcript_20342/m.77880 type:complete len:832 (+) Transcript_20342:97-2592(+)